MNTSGTCGEAGGHRIVVCGKALQPSHLLTHEKALLTPKKVGVRRVSLGVRQFFTTAGGAVVVLFHRQQWGSFVSPATPAPHIPWNTWRCTIWICCWNRSEGLGQALTLFALWRNGHWCCLRHTCVMKSLHILLYLSGSSSHNFLLFLDRSKWWNQIYMHMCICAKAQVILYLWPNPIPHCVIVYSHDNWVCVMGGGMTRRANRRQVRCFTYFWVGTLTA